MIARHCQQYAQPLSPAVSRANNACNTDNPSTSVVTVVRNYLQTCSHVMYTNRGYYSRAVFIFLRASDCVAAIQGWCLFKKNTVVEFLTQPYLIRHQYYLRNLACTLASLQNLVWWETYIVEGNLCGYNTEFGIVFVVLMKYQQPLIRCYSVSITKLIW